MPDLDVTVDELSLDANWTDANPETRAAIQDVLPVNGDAARWGDELYFRTPVDVPLENGQVEAPVGTIAYWPQGNAICIFWGPTPASDNETPRAASPVAIIANLTDPSPLTDLSGSAHVRIATNQS